MRITAGHWLPQRGIRRLDQHRNHGLEIVVIRAGRFPWAVEGVAEDAGPGEVFFTMPWQRHGGRRPEQPNGSLSFAIIPLADDRSAAYPAQKLAFHPALGLPLSAQDQAAVLAQLAASGRHAFPAGRELPLLIPALVDAVTIGPANRVPALATLAVLALADVVRSAAAAAEPTHRVRDFLPFLAEHCCAPWTLAGMAARCRLGRTRFADLIERETGDSPHRLLLRLRANRLADLLTTTRRPLLELSLACGFCSSQHAARVFKAFHGVAPAAWRRRGAPQA